MQQSKRSFWFHYIPFLILQLVYLAVTLFLFHRQTVNYAGGYISDIGPYILEMQGLNSGYDFPYPVLFLTGRLFLPFTTPAHAMAFAVTLLNGLTGFVMKYYFDCWLLREDMSDRRRILYGNLSNLLTFSLLFASMIYPLTWLGQYHEPGADFLYRYLGVFTPNPYHNATFLATRPFTIPVFFLFFDLLKEYEKAPFHWDRRYVLFSAFLLLTTLTKPSFTLPFAAFAGLIMLYRLCRRRFTGWKAFLSLGIWFIPAYIALLYQFRNVFVPTQDLDKGIGFGLFTAWSSICDNIPLALLYGTAFPLCVGLIALLLRRKDPLLLYTWGFYLTSLLMMVLLYEKGYRLTHVNFSWGYMHGLFFLYLISLLRLMLDTMNKEYPRKWLLPQWVLYGLHLICGVDYFRILLQGGLFH